jgi:hypothetical protein
MTTDLLIRTNSKTTAVRVTIWLPPQHFARQPGGANETNTYTGSTWLAVRPAVTSRIARHKTIGAIQLTLFQRAEYYPLRFRNQFQKREFYY